MFLQTGQKIVAGLSDWEGSYSSLQIVEAQRNQMSILCATLYGVWQLLPLISKLMASPFDVPHRMTTGLIDWLSWGLTSTRYKIDHFGALFSVNVLVSILRKITTGKITKLRMKSQEVPVTAEWPEHFSDCLSVDDDHHFICSQKLETSRWRRWTVYLDVRRAAGLNPVQVPDHHRRVHCRPSGHQVAVSVNSQRVTGRRVEIQRMHLPKRHPLR